MTDRPAPVFRGVRIYNDPDGVFRVRHALNWHTFDMPDRPEGILFSPEAQNPTTWVAAWKEDLGVPVAAEDICFLARSLDKGIRTLGENVQVSYAHQEVIGHIIRLERIFSYEQDGVLHERRQWLIYADHYQVVLLYHAHDQDEYAHWLGMANYSFGTFELPPFLYFAAEKRAELLATRPAGNPERR